MRAPDRYSPAWEEFEPLSSADPAELTVYPSDGDGDDDLDLLGPDGAVILRRRRHPIGFARPEDACSP